MVGFFNLHDTPGSTEDYWLFPFFIDKSYQRNGFGAAAIEELCRHLKENQPDCQLTRLTVHPENDAGVKFYTTLGFTDDHVLTYGEPTFSRCLRGGNQQQGYRS